MGTRNWKNNSKYKTYSIKKNSFRISYISDKKKREIRFDRYMCVCIGKYD